MRIRKFSVLANLNAGIETSSLIQTSALAGDTTLGNSALWWNPRFGGISSLIGISLKFPARLFQVAGWNSLQAVEYGELLHSQFAIV